MMVDDEYQFHLIVVNIIIIMVIVINVIADVIIILIGYIREDIR